MLICVIRVFVKSTFLYLILLRQAKNAEINSNNPEEAVQNKSFSKNNNGPFDYIMLDCRIII